MDINRSSGKFVQTRKQQLQLQNELKVLRDKALLSHYKKCGTSPNRCMSASDSPKSCVKQPPTSKPNRTSIQQKPSTMSQEPRKVKFAIMSSLNTTRPLPYAKREPRRSVATEISHKTSTKARKETEEVLSSVASEIATPDPDVPPFCDDPSHVDSDACSSTQGEEYDCALDKSTQHTRRLVSVFDNKEHVDEEDSSQEALQHVKEPSFTISTPESNLVPVLHADSHSPVGTNDPCLYDEAFIFNSSLPEEESQSDITSSYTSSCSSTPQLVTCQEPFGDYVHGHHFSSQEISSIDYPLSTLRCHTGSISKEFTPSTNSLSSTQTLEPDEPSGSLSPDSTHQDHEESSSSPGCHTDYQCLPDDYTESHTALSDHKEDNIVLNDLTEDYSAEHDHRQYCVGRPFRESPPEPIPTMPVVEPVIDTSQMPHASSSSLYDSSTELGLLRESRHTDVIIRSSDSHADELLDSTVRLEDILNVTGKSVKDSIPGTRSYPPLDVSTHRKDSVSIHTSIHHFCTDNQYPQLELPLQLLSRQTHVEASKEGRAVSLQTKQTLPADNPFKSIDIVPEFPTTICSQYKELAMTGHSMELKSGDAFRLQWRPAPPKFSLHPTLIQNKLSAQYKLVSDCSTAPDYNGSQKTVLVQGLEDEEQPATASRDNDTKSSHIGQRSLKSSSVPTFETFLAQLTSKPQETHNKESEQVIDLTPPEVPSSPDVGLITGSETIGSLQSKSISKLPVANTFHRPFTTGSKEFHHLCLEIDSQRKNLIYHHKIQQTPLPEVSESLDQLDSSDLGPPLALQESMLEASGMFTARKLQRQFMKGTKRHTGKGRVRAIKRTKSAQLRAEKARELLSQPASKLLRRASFPCLLEHLHFSESKGDNSRELSHWSSQPLLDEELFSGLMLRLGARPDVDDHSDWVYKIWWDTWFPEVLQECRDAVAELSGTHKPKTAIVVKTSHKSHSDTITKSDPTNSINNTGPCAPANSLLDLANIQPFPADMTRDQQLDIEKEIAVVDQTIEECNDEQMLAVHYCRRGNLARMLGRLVDSSRDVNQCLSIRPHMTDALWQRHILFLIQGHKKRAMEDLTLLLKHNKKHYGAYRSKAALLLEMGDLGSAVYYISQAVAIHPTDPDSYFLRAEIHEKRGEIESAISDYAKVSELDPANFEALSRPAMHKYNKGMWAASAQHFSALLLRDPNNTEARIHRAKACYNIGQYAEALQDLSAAIHLEPAGANAYFHRACLLRNTQPMKALKDFSVSLLLDDSVSNINALLHRGVLYTQLKCYSEALLDFEAAVRLKRTSSSPHICAGLVHMLHKNNITRAIQCFSTALFVEPTCVRAYLCRASAFEKDAKYKLALLDYAKAIHLEPDNPTYYLQKGALYLCMGELELSTMHISIAAKLNTGFHQNKAQRALVNSFLGNHQQAIELLLNQVKSHEICFLLGRIQFKAGDYKAATESLKQAIYLAERNTKPSHLVTRVTSRGEIDKTGYRETMDDKLKSSYHFVCGKSLVELGLLKEAVNEFSKVLEISPDNAKAQFECGVTKLLDNAPRGMSDINKSLALNPRLFQAFLARASYYGKIGRFSKAILNCNEAIRLQPASVRAYLCRGSLRYHIKMYDSAIDDFSTAIRLDPKHTSLAHFNRALCYQASGNQQKALVDFSAVFLIDEKPSFQMLINRALLYLDLQDWSNALQDFIMAGKIVQDDPGIFQAIGYCYHRLGILDSSIMAYTEALKYDEKFLEAYIGRGNAYIEYLSLDGNNKSRSDYLKTLELNPNYFPAKVNLALLLQSEGEFQKAWNELTAVLKVTPQYVPALEARAVISLQMGNLFGSLIDISAAIQVNKTALLLTNRGVIHQFMGDVVSAMKDYIEAVKLNKAYKLAHFNMGNILFQQRHYKQAVDCYSKAVGSKEIFDSVVVNRGITYAVMGDMDSALVDFNAAITSNPFSAHVHFNRGNLYHSLHEFSKAEQDYKQALALQPNDPLTMLHYGEVLKKLDRSDSAKAMFSRVFHSLV